MNTFWERIVTDTVAGTIFDGDRRYFLMRPDVLMGMFRNLPEESRVLAMAALAASAREHGGKSVAAYRQAGGKTLLAQTMVDGAAAFGWGRWTVASHAHEVELDVVDSPFAAGHGPSATPVCAPIAGIFHSLARTLLERDLEVTEVRCAAQHGGACRFVARAVAPEQA